MKTVIQDIVVVIVEVIGKEIIAEENIALKEKTEKIIEKIDIEAKVVKKVEAEAKEIIKRGEIVEVKAEAEIEEEIIQGVVKVIVNQAFQEVIVQEGRIIV